MRPPRALHSARTAPIPMPRPESSCHLGLVEMPSVKSASARSGSLPCGRPRRLAASTACQSMPRPSSLISITNAPPSGVWTAQSYRAAPCPRRGARPWPRSRDRPRFAPGGRRTTRTSPGPRLEPQAVVGDPHLERSLVEAAGDALDLLGDPVEPPRGRLEPPRRHAPGQLRARLLALQRVQHGLVLRRLDLEHGADAVAEQDVDVTRRRSKRCSSSARCSAPGRSWSSSMLLSSWWHRSATVLMPNIAVLPLSVCSARRTSTWMRSARRPCTSPGLRRRTRESRRGHASADRRSGTSRAARARAARARARGHVADDHQQLLKLATLLIAR